MTIPKSLKHPQFGIFNGNQIGKPIREVYRGADAKSQ